MLDETEGQAVGSVGRSVEVLRVEVSEVWAELVAGEEGSVPGQSNARLVLSAEVQDAPAAGDRPSLSEAACEKPSKNMPRIPMGISHPDHVPAFQVPPG